jgi:hypothetical protein
MDTDKFDPAMNTENLIKSLQTLRHMYEDVARTDANAPLPVIDMFADTEFDENSLTNEAEFRAYDVLLNLHDTNCLKYAHLLDSSLPFQTSTDLHASRSSVGACSSGRATVHLCTEQ